MDAPYMKAIMADEHVAPKCLHLHNHWCHTGCTKNEECIKCLVEKYATAKDEAARQGNRVRDLVNENIMLTGKVKELEKKHK
jgi:hypothetical protein